MPRGQSDPVKGLIFGREALADKRKFNNPRGGDKIYLSPAVGSDYTTTAARVNFLNAPDSINVCEALRDELKSTIDEIDPNLILTFKGEPAFSHRVKEKLRSETNERISPPEGWGYKIWAEYQDGSGLTGEVFAWVPMKALSKIKNDEKLFYLREVEYASERLMTWNEALKRSRELIIARHKR